MAAQGRNRAIERGFNIFPPADFARHCAGNMLIRRPSHKLQRFADPLLGHDVEVGRLLQLDGQRLFERTIENRLLSCIDEVGQQNGILHSQPLGTMHVNQDCTSDRRPPHSIRAQQQNRNVG